MKKILFIAATLFPFFILGQSQDQNYVLTKIYKEPNTSSVANPTLSQAAQNITYFDGLGRPIEQIAHKQSPNGKDLVTHIEYDAFGRQVNEFLPIVLEETLNFQNTTRDNVTGFYASQGLASENSQFPYSYKELEASPLNRVMVQWAPGEKWTKEAENGHPIRFDYQTNINDEVTLFKAATTWNDNSGLYDISLSTQGYYKRNQLYKTITKDENWNPQAVAETSLLNTTEEFKDKDGHVVLKRTYNYEDGGIVKAYDTYYVYDDYGNLTYVLPPLASAAGDFGQNVLDNLCYQYKYDYRNRLAAKKLPGKQWEFIVYNPQDLPVATGPVPNPWGDDSSGWMITKYDAYGRVVYTGWKLLTVDEQNRKAIENELANNWVEHFLTDRTTTIDNIQVSYTNDTEPKTLKLLTVNYYDTYAHVFGPEVVPTNIQGQNVLTSVKGLATGSWVRVLTAPSSADAEVTHVFYDKKGRVIQNHKINHFGGYTIIDSKLDFAGKTQYTISTHKRANSDEELRVKDTFEYTPQDLLLWHKQKINDRPEELIVKNNYDPLGKLWSKQVGGHDFTDFKGYQKVDYSYNIRGWLKSINDIDHLHEENSTDPIDLFAFRINYTDSIANTIGGEVQSLYNGNIAETTWRSSSDNVLRRYGYNYDNLNRLKKGIYQKPGATYPVTNMYNEEINYDYNGNITALKRNGDLDDPWFNAAIQIDDLSYTYHDEKKNQLMKVTDISNHPKGFTDDSTDDPNDSNPDYEYDDNGNLTRDTNKHINEIHYNHLNLPTKIHFAWGDKIEYLYNALGQKVEKRVMQDTLSIRTNYLDGYQYTDDLLSLFPHAEGYVKVNFCQPCTENRYRFNYVYNYTDHLGNIRLSYGFDKETEQIKILEENHYYPFGMKHLHYNVSTKDYKLIQENENPTPGFDPKIQPVASDAILYKYKFNKKEWQDELGLNFYDYGARNYDPAIGRWINIDPLAEKYRRWSPYTYCVDNPMRFVDPDGMRNLDILKDIIVTSKDGTVLFTLNDGKKAKTKMTAEQLYKKGTQWFEPLANNYMPLKSISAGTYSDKLKHFSSQQIKDFANKDRWMSSYGSGGSGDWKGQKEGGDGYLLVTVDGKPYWGDAIGQIPFATNKAKDEIKNGETVYDANVKTIRAGQKYADGSLFGGTPDTSKSYDNFMILRGSLYGTQGRDITRPITQEEATMYGY